MCKVKKVVLFTLIIGSLLIGSIPTTWAGPAEEAAQMAEQWFKFFYHSPYKIPHINLFRLYLLPA